MPEIFKVLAQADITASLAALYTVPAATSVVISSIVIANRSSNTRTFTLKHAIAGAADSPQQSLYAGVNLTKNNTFVVTGGFVMAATDVLRVVADAASALSITVYGTEIT